MGVAEIGASMKRESSLARVLVAYATIEGQTSKIAHRIADQIGRHGHQIVLVDVHEAEARGVADEFDAAVIAGSIHMGQHDKELTAFVRRHQTRLSEAPSAFVSVSLAAGRPKYLQEVAGWAKDFYRDSGWTADVEHHAAGALRDRRLGFFKKLMLHRFMQKEGVKLDPSGDTEFTEWTKLEVFIEGFLAKAGLADA